MQAAERKYDEANREKRLAKNKRYYEQNYDVCIAKSREYDAAHREERYQKALSYYHANPDQRREYNRARKKEKPHESVAGRIAREAIARGELIP